jgi:hypothetical protein
MEGTSWLYVFGSMYLPISHPFIRGCPVSLDPGPLWIVIMKGLRSKRGYFMRWHNVGPVAYYPLRPEPLASWLLNAFDFGHSFVSLAAPVVE